MPKTRKMKGGGYPMDWNNYSDQDKETYCALNYTSIRQGGFFGKKGGYHLENDKCVKGTKAYIPKFQVGENRGTLYENNPTSEPVDPNYSKLLPQQSPLLQSSLPKVVDNVSPQSPVSPGVDVNAANVTVGGRRRRKNSKKRKTRKIKRSLRRRRH